MKTEQSAIETEAERAVIGYEGLYEVSSLGRVRSLRFRNRTTDKLRSVPTLLKPVLRNRYPAIKLQDTIHAVHAIVARAFIGERPEGFQIAHQDGNRDNPMASNLKYMTVSDNCRQKAQHGTLPLGESVHNAKLTDDRVLLMRSTPCFKGIDGHFSALFGVVPTAINAARRGKTWRHLNQGVKS